MANYVSTIYFWLAALLGALPAAVFIILYLKRIPQTWICRRWDIRRYRRSALDCVLGKKHDPPYQVFRRYRYEPECYVDRHLELDRPYGQPTLAREYFRGRVKNEDQFFLLLYGEFGIGKTALCFDLLHEFLACASSGCRYFPVYLPIREYTKNKVEKVSELLRDCLEKWGLERVVFKGYGSIRRFLNKQRILLIVDSLDQIDESGDGRVPAKFLDDLYTCFAGTSSSLLVTVCSDYLEHNSHYLNRILRCYDWVKLGAFDDRQALEYLRRHTLKRENSTIETEVYNRLCADVYLARLLSNPLLLDVIMHYGVSEDPHAGAGKIYAAYVEDWVRQDGHFIPFAVESRWSLVQDLALELLRSEPTTGVRIDKRAELRMLKKTKGWTEWPDCIEHLTRAASNEDIRYYNIEKRIRSFLRVNRDRTVGFVHRSVMNYFCARWAIGRLRKWQDAKKPTVEHSDLARIYSNLVIWFMRSMVETYDQEWLLKTIRSNQPFVRRISYALLTGLQGLPDMQKSIRELLETEWDEERSKGEDIDMECMRHIAYGLGWAGGNPCSKDRLDFIEQHLSKWLESAFVYYHTPTRQREHCIGRLKAFRIGNPEYHNNRGLYILDLANVGQFSDIDLIEPYTDPRREVDIEVRRLGFKAITQIISRS